MQKTDEQMAAAASQAPPKNAIPKDSPEQRATKVATDGSYADKIRRRSANAASPT